MNDTSFHIATVSNNLLFQIWTPLHFSKLLPVCITHFSQNSSRRMSSHTIYHSRHPWSSYLKEPRTYIIERAVQLIRRTSQQSLRVEYRQLRRTRSELVGNTLYSIVVSRKIAVFHSKKSIFLKHFVSLWWTLTLSQCHFTTLVALLYAYQHVFISFSRITYWCPTL